MSGRTSSILKFFKPTPINDAQGNVLTSQEKLESRLAADRPRMEQEKDAAKNGAIAKRQREEDIFELGEWRSGYFAFLKRDLTERVQRREKLLKVLDKESDAVKEYSGPTIILKNAAELPLQKSSGHPAEERDVDMAAPCQRPRINWSLHPEVKAQAIAMVKKHGGDLRPALRCL